MLLKHSKNGLFLIALISAFYASVAVASNKSSSEKANITARTYALYACNLRPFNRSYVDVAVKEKKARQKVRERCEKKEGKLNIFCKEEKADCTPVEVRIRE